ncbi:hypothetical protein P8A22_31415 [Streptomyces laculatispora]|uniref:Uncharacterized protein n=1 Tax=Streptomyces laculatispora TaxID=887464 RepID=A0ABY9IAV8_9ACTN|nr:hypothetical protein [Streptomyces laculatispora]WLQ44031.1 hypothetical protein P8A22_31415 [Streptomyces laculatispora]
MNPAWPQHPSQVRRSEKQDLALNEDLWLDFLNRLDGAYVNERQLDDAAVVLTA